MRRSGQRTHLQVEGELPGVPNTTYRLQVELMSSNFDGNPSSAAAVPSIGELKQRVIAVGQAQIEMQTPRPTLFVEMLRDGDVVTVEAFMIIYWIRTATASSTPSVARRAATPASVSGTWRRARRCRATASAPRP